MTPEIQISSAKTTTAKITRFAQEEWVLVNNKHYGEGINIENLHFRFVAESNLGGILGVLDLILKANVAYIDSLVVGHKHRNQGIARMLVSFAEAFSRERSCTKVWLDTAEDWAAATVYKKLGFEITGTHEAHYCKRVLIFTKFL